MTEAAKEIFDQAMSLPPAERLEVAEHLLDFGSGEVSADPGYVAAWEKEIDRRIGEAERGEVELIPRETVLAELGQRHAEGRVPPGGQTRSR